VISKPVPANSFYHTCRYICQKSGAEVLIAEGVRGHNFKVMAEDFINQQQMRPGKEKACFHSILSFHPKEKPSDEIMMEIARKYLQHLGIVNTQFAVSKHTDKAHLHLHIVANMVDNNGKVISDSWIGLRGKKIAQQLTQEYNLIPAIQKDLSITHVEAMSELEANKYKIYIAIAENLPHCRTMDDLEKRLLALGIETQYKYKGQTQEKQGVSFKIGNVCFKGSQVDRKFSIIGLQRALEQHQKQQQGISQQGEATNQMNPSYKRKARSLRPSDETSNSAPEKDFKPGIGQGLAKALEILMRPEHEDGPLPYDLTEEALLRRRKKNAQRPR